MPPLEDRFRVAIFDEFLDAFAKIPRQQQKKVNRFVRKFRQDPTANSINYERIHSFADDNLRTVRIDEAYRAIVLRPEQGNVYVLLWVDHHDKAIGWAENKRVAVHPETGSLQVLTVQPGEGSAPQPEPSDRPALFDHIRDRELLRLGVPEALLQPVRAVRDMQQLDALEQQLPDEAYEALFFLAEGESLADVEEALAAEPVEDVDTADFEAALERDASKRRFVVVGEDEELEAVLDAPLEKWRIFLHPSQRQLVYRSWNGPVRVLGGAGTGKTVVAMHRAAYLAGEVFNEPGDRVLFTTFTANLAADIEANLKKLCQPEVQKRIEVIHLDRWVTRLLKRSGYEYEIAYWPGDKRLQTAWERAMALAEPGAFPDSFYRDEWEAVVQPQGCARWEDYKKASRAGRGQGLNRAQRKQAWPVFEEYRNQLEKRSLREPEHALRDAASLLKAGKASANYSTIVVDEAQDMTTNAFALLRQVLPERPNDLFIVGDGHQRIYRRKVVLGRAGINIRGRRGRRLRINYRTTEEIRRFAVAMLEGAEVDDLDGGQDTTKGYKSLMHGQTPTVETAPDFDTEVEIIANWAQQGPLEQTCLVARTKALRDKYERALKTKGFQTYPLKRSAPENTSTPGLRVATMHRVKGLEFDRMIIAGVNDDLIPLKDALEKTTDKTIRQDIEFRERALLYVATTRAKEAALITANGKESQWASCAR